MGSPGPGMKHTILVITSVASLDALAFTDCPHPGYHPQITIDKERGTRSVFLIVLEAGKSKDRLPVNFDMSSLPAFLLCVHEGEEEGESKLPVSYEGTDPTALPS